MADFPTGHRFGRYHVRDVLGRGAFGVVYLGFDEELHRSVAIKVPHRECVQTERDIDDYIREARTVAQLDHDGVVAVFDVGRTNEGLCYVVSHYVDGESLAARIASGLVSISDAVTWTASVAETLDYVHQKSVIHRDIKPGNILLSADEKAYVTDFGLALRDHQLSSRFEISGTPKYMSPEQAQGESHLVDGRSDIFSLGIVLYKLITGVNPFTGADTDAVLDSIVHSAPQPPREINPAISLPLQRICLKALSKPIGQRYARASLMAKDLKSLVLESGSNFEISANSVEEPTQLVLSGDRLAGVTPKGLRSFDDKDARFFRKLLPGPFDVEGLPESLHFWKTRIESANAAETFRVGVIYGPSGCGKSSLVKAGLLPILDSNVRTIFTEAAPEQTENRLLARLGNPRSSEKNGTLRSCLQALKNTADSTQKTLIVIDQFEQWLHTTADPSNSDLAKALRQCDGEHLQCILLVRDDFWLAVSRFMTCLDIDLAQNQNMRLVDLFDPQHARRVLAEFGCGYGRLPENLAQLSGDQNKFLDAAIDGLSQNEKIIPVRLALFAEMVKGRSWTLDTLKSLGGMEGVGARFLEECFESPMAPAEQRVHRAGVHRTLMALLPERGTDIKGAMKSYEELLHASGYAAQPEQFRSLLRILDNNLRLITPTDPMGLSPEEATDQSGMRFYQLTHDFLVPAIRERLTAEERSTRRGRAELLLREMTAGWQQQPERKSLPAWSEWLQIQLLTDRNRWTELQKRVLSAATRRITTTLLFCAGIACVIAFAVYRYSGQAEAESLVAQLAIATTEDVPDILAQLPAYQQWAVPRLQTLQADPNSNSRTQMLTALALLPADAKQEVFLRDQLLKCPPNEQPLLLDALEPNKSDICKTLWETLADESAESQIRFQAALALARFDPPTKSNSDSWATYIPFVARQLVESATYDRGSYSAVLSSAMPLNEIIARPLSDIVANDDGDAVQQNTAVQLLISLLSEKPDLLATRILSADFKYVSQVLPILDEHRAEVVASLTGPVTSGYEDTLSREDWTIRARRQSMAAALLLRFREPSLAWNVFRTTPQADARTYLIHLVGKMNVDPTLLEARLRKESDTGIRTALLLALGEFSPDQWDPADRESLSQLVADWYRNDPDASVHAHAEWLLRQWKGSEHVVGISLRKTEGRESGDVLANWRLDDSGLVMAKINSQRTALPAFEMSTKEVSCRFVKSINSDYFWEPEHAESDDCAAFSMSWFEAIDFCQQLTLNSGMSEADLCYEEVDTTEKYRLRPNYRSLAGYRLPTSEEFEYALRGKAETDYDFGNDIQMITHYEWVNLPSGAVSRVPGQKKPNRFGLFDTNGNVSEWCGDLKNPGDRRVALGGARNSKFDFIADNPNQYGEVVPDVRWRAFGFRLVRSVVDSGQ